MKPLWRAVLYGVILGAAWAVPAFLTGNVYHPAPLLVAAVVPLAVGFAKPAPRPGLRLAGAVCGAALALGISAVLAATGHLDGKPLLPGGGALAEAVAFSLIGAVVGAVVGIARRR